MIIKSVELKNIRSYLDEKIEFPSGSTLLAGDIGTGKSTILLAVEFALFGFRKGEVSGSDILRHGKDNGSVKLHFEIEGKDIIIERPIKRSRDSIAQENCSLSTNSVREELTPVELKSKVLDMFGYPQDMLKKNKPLFRFTVYTPQEEMKRILMDEEDRLDILRSIFGIDKYGTIRNNSRTFMTELRRMKTGLEGELKVMESDASRLDEIQQNKESLHSQLALHRSQLAEAAKEADEKKSEIDLLKKDFKDVNAVRHELTRKESELSAKKRRIEQIKSEINEADDRIRDYEQIIRQVPVPKPLENLRSELSGLEKRKEHLVAKKAILNEETYKLQKIYNEGVCGLCGQKVHNPEEFAMHIEEIKLRIDQITPEMEQISSSIVECKNVISSGEKIQQYAHLAKDLDERKLRLTSEADSVTKDMSSLDRDVEFLRPRTAGYEDLQEKISAAESAFYALQKNKSDAERIVARCEQQVEDLEKRINEIMAKMREAQKIKERIMRISDLLKWFEHFIDLMETMEKHVMFAIQKEFNQYFQNWFSVLMSEQLSVKIDQRFSPVIEQNSYITEYENLSGGEKTSVALAYRLALNKVVNDMINTIRTKNLLILDEPTDGFSTDQLDRIRDVINELNMKQIIIVSHEPKIDTYVDNVIKIHKENHVSKVSRF